MRACIRFQLDTAVCYTYGVCKHARVCCQAACDMTHAIVMQEEMEKCREAFEQFDMDKSGTIEPWELKVVTYLVSSICSSQSLGRVYFGRQHNTVADTLFWIGQETLIAMGQTPTDEDLAEMFLELDHDNSGGIDFPEVLKGGGARKGGKKRW